MGVLLVRKNGEWIFFRQIAVFATVSELQADITHLIKWMKRIYLVEYSQVLWGI